MKDVSWNKDFVSTVTVDDSKVDLTKVGEYTLTYTIKGTKEEKETKDASVDVTEVKATESEESTETQKATVEVISEEDTQAKVNGDGSVTTPNNDVKGTTDSTNNSSGKSTTTTPATPETPKTHEHNWQPVYTTVHHDAVTHTEKQDQGHYETTTTTVYVHEYENGKVCEFTSSDEASAHAEAYALQGIDVWSSVQNRITETWIPDVVTVTVVDKEAYDEQVISGYILVVVG